MESKEKVDAAPSALRCSAAESVVYGLVVGPSSSDVREIAGAAMEDKAKMFKEYGWDINHKITEGDVKCVLRAIMATAIKRMKSGR